MKGRTTQIMDLLIKIKISENLKVYKTRIYPYIKCSEFRIISYMAFGLQG